MSTVSYIPTHETTGVNPANWIEFEITPESGNYLNPLASAGYGLSITIGHLGGANAIVSNGLATSWLTDWGWEWTISDLTPAVDEAITVRIRLVGGFNANTSYGYPTAADPSDHYVVSVACGENVDGLDDYTVHSDAPWFSTGDALPVEITTTTLPDAFIAGTPYSETVEASGGAEPYAWSITDGELPGGLTIDAGTGEISGTPTWLPGTYTFEVTVTDDVDDTDTQWLSITLTGSGVVSLATTLSPLAIGVGAIALSDAATQVVAMTNYAASRRGTVHYSFGSTEIAGTEQPPIEGHFPATLSGYREWFVTRIWIDPDVQNVDVGYRCYFSTATHGGRIRTTIGATNVVVTADQTHNGTERAGTVTAAAIGSDGWVDVLVEVERLVGTTGTAFVRNARCQDQAIADTDLPMPVDD